MKSTTVLCLAVAAAAFAGPASAVFKCTTAKGIVYQDRPCREGEETDVRLTVNTSEFAPKANQNSDEATLNTRPDGLTRSVTPARSSNDGSPAGTKSTGRKNADAAAGESDSGRRKDSSTLAARDVPITSEQARKTDPSAKYYSTESFSAGSETPTQMNCESPSGERRTFYLSNGKLTSI